MELTLNCRKYSLCLATQIHTDFEPALPPGACDSAKSI